MRDYKIIKESTAGKLQLEVREHILLGYVPCGGVAAGEKSQDEHDTYRGVVKTEYLQAMVKI